MGCSSAPCTNPHSLDLLWLEGAIKELKWKLLVEKSCLPSEKLNSILFLLVFECFQEQISVSEVCSVHPSRACKGCGVQITPAQLLHQNCYVLGLQLSWGIPVRSVAGGKSSASTCAAAVGPGPVWVCGCCRPSETCALQPGLCLLLQLSSVGDHECQWPWLSLSLSLCGRPAPGCD